MFIVQQEKEFSTKKIETFQMKALSCFQWAAMQNLQNILNDAELTDSLTHALLRLKAKRVPMMLSTVLRMQLWQKHCARRSFQALEIDHSDSLEVRKFYAMELIALGRRSSNGITNESLAIINDMDDFVRARIQNALANIDKDQASQLNDDEEMNDADYLSQILNCNRKFGCATLESCNNQYTLIKKHFEKIFHEAKELNAVLATNMNLYRFSNEIYYVNRLFDKLSNEIQ